MQLFQFSEQQEFVASATQHLAQRIIELQKDPNRVVRLGLSGGSTPGPMYSALATLTGIDWNRVLLFLVDDRHVDADHKDSNQRLVYEKLTSKLPQPIPKEHICFPDTTLDITSCIKQYEQDIHKQVGQLADLLVLGMGPDGHIASLFPPLSDSLLNSEHFVLHTTTENFAVRDRISLSYQFFLMQTNCEFVFLMSGEEKKLLWEQVMAIEEVKGESKFGFPVDEVKQYPALPLRRKKTVVYFLSQPKK